MHTTAAAATGTATPEGLYESETEEQPFSGENFMGLSPIRPNPHYIKLLLLYFYNFNLHLHVKFFNFKIYNLQYNWLYFELYAFKKIYYISYLYIFRI